MKTPESHQVASLNLVANCTQISSRKWDQMMEGTTRADVTKINQIVRHHLPEIARELGLFDKSLKDLTWYNPYTYYKSKRYLVLVHSSIEYFFRYTTKN